MNGSLAVFVCVVCSALAAQQLVEPGYGMEKRKSAYMRFGRSDPQLMGDEEFDMEKRKSAYMRFGKRSAADSEPEMIDEEAVNGMEKRKSAYMRFGKRKSAYMRFGKRSDAMELPEPMDMEKRKSAYMRFGR